jgi:2-iminobutanoate/2-iminopropanoate deaminase
MMATATQINPWSWQDRFGYSQAWRVDEPRSLVFVAGQGPISTEGELVGPGDFERQARQTLANLATVLDDAGADMKSVIKLTVYLTDIANLRDYGRIRAELMQGHAPSGTAVEVSALAVPGMMIEVEAIAAI